jgi:hypothetical protein
VAAYARGHSDIRPIGLQVCPETNSNITELTAICTDEVRSEDHGYVLHVLAAILLNDDRSQANRRM